MPCRLLEGEGELETPSEIFSLTARNRCTSCSSTRRRACISCVDFSRKMIWFVAKYGRVRGGHREGRGAYLARAATPCCSFGWRQGERPSIWHSHRVIRLCASAQPQFFAVGSLLCGSGRGSQQRWHPCLRRQSRSRSDHERVCRRSLLLGKGSGCSVGDCDVLGLYLWRKTGSLSRYCFWNGGRCRPLMCLILKWGETRDHTCEGRAEGESQQAGPLTHVVAMRCTRVADIDAWT